MRSSTLSGVVAATLSATVLGGVLAACGGGLAPLALDPAGPLDVRVGTTVAFEAAPAPSGLAWTVAGVAGGDATVGTVTASGVYAAPARVPTDATVLVRATDAADATRTAAAQVRLTAPGTAYVLEYDAIYVYGDLDAVAGDVAPDRTFAVAGSVTEYMDMALVPALDLAFVLDRGELRGPYRVGSIGSATGTVDAVGFDLGTAGTPRALAYDAARDVLYVAANGVVLAYDDASTAPEGASAARELAVPAGFDARLALDAANDRLYLSAPAGTVSVIDDVSQRDGAFAVDRTIDLTDGSGYLWGMALDASRDELYLTYQAVDARVYVIAAAATADGATAATRTIGGATHGLDRPTQLAYDAVHDRLVAALSGATPGFAVFDAASTLDGDVAADRVVSGAALPIGDPYGVAVDATQ